MAGDASSSPTLSELRSCAFEQRMPNKLMDCKNPLYFITKNQRSSVFSYMKDVAFDWAFLDGHVEVVVLRALRYFDRFIHGWNTVTNCKWTSVEDSLNRYRKVSSLVLSQTVGRDCADHILSFIQRSDISEDVTKRHQDDMRNLAEKTSLVCLVLSVKFEGRWDVNLYQNIALYTLDGRVNKQELIEHEVSVLSMIDWRLNFFPPCQFLELLYNEVGFTPDDDFKRAANDAVRLCSVLSGLQSRSACVLATVAILVALRHRSRRDLYPFYFEPLRVACGVNAHYGSAWLSHTTAYVLDLFVSARE